MCTGIYYNYKGINFFIIVIYKIWPTYGFSSPSLTAPLEMVA